MTESQNMIQRLFSLFYSYLKKPREVRQAQIIQLSLLVLTVIIVSFSLIFPSFAHSELKLNPKGPWALSKNAPENIIAIVDVEFLMEKQYEKAQEEAARQTPLRLTRDFGALKKFEEGENEEGNRENSFQELLGQDIRNLRICRAANKQNASIAQCVYAKAMRWRSLKAEDWNSLLRFSSTSLKRRLGQLVNAIFENYAILKTAEEDLLFKDFKGSTVRVHDIKQGTGGEVDVPWGKVITRRQLYDDANIREELQQLAKTVFPNSSRKQHLAFLKLARAYLYRLDACRFEKNETLTSQKKQRSQVPLADYVFQIKRGESIVRNGDVITENIHKALEVHQSDRWWEVLRRLFAIIAQQVIFLAFVLYYIIRFADKRINDLSSNLVVFVTLWLFALVLLFTENLWMTDLKENEISHFFGAWVPMALFSILLALSLGERLSLPLVLYMSFLVFIASRYDPMSLLFAITLSLTGLILGTRIKKRVHFISISFAIGLLSVVLVTIGYLYSNRGDISRL